MRERAIDDPRGTTGAEAPPARGLSRADLHVHTTFSDGVARPEEVLNHHVLKAGSRVIAITDHDTIDGALWARDHRERHRGAYDRLELIVGEEISTTDGHVLGLYLERRIPPRMSAAETIAAIHEQGGLAVAAHPYTCWMRWAGLVGVGDLIRELPFDAVETRNSNFTEILANRRAERNAGAKARVGASDGHFLAAAGRCATLFAGETARDLREELEAARTIATGSCYGLPTLLAYVWARLRAGDSIWPTLGRPSRALTGPARVTAPVEEDAPLHAIAGTLGGRLGERLLDAAAARIEEGAPILLDLSRVNAADGVGVTVLLECVALAARHGAPVACLRPSRPARRILRSSGLASLLPIFAGPGEAARWVEGRGIAPGRAGHAGARAGQIAGARVESGASP